MRFSSQLQIITKGKKRIFTIPHLRTNLHQKERSQSQIIYHLFSLIISFYNQNFDMVDDSSNPEAHIGSYS